MSGERVVVHRGCWSRACCASERGQGRPWAFVLQVGRGAQVAEVDLDLSGTLAHVCFCSLARPPRRSILKPQIPATCAPAMSASIAEAEAAGAQTGPPAGQEGK
eukprot:15462226-Alexandrium_andersonii.AAC.1